MTSDFKKLFVIVVVLAVWFVAVEEALRIMWLVWLGVYCNWLCTFFLLWSTLEFLILPLKMSNYKSS